MYVPDTKENKLRVKLNDSKLLCENGTSCHLSWATAGYGMIRKNSSSLWSRDTLDVFLQLDQLFGKNYKFLTSPFAMFAQFDGQSNILFHDDTIKLRSVPTVKNTDKMKKPYDSVLEYVDKCSFSSHLMPSFNLIFSSIIAIKFLIFFL